MHHRNTGLSSCTRYGNYTKTLISLLPTGGVRLGHRNGVIDLEEHWSKGDRHTGTAPVVRAELLYTNGTVQRTLRC
jgi:hypothetical protein